MMVLRAALLCVTSDLPAVRKITQFLGHKADLGVRDVHSVQNVSQALLGLRVE